MPFGQLLLFTAVILDKIVGKNSTALARGVASLMVRFVAFTWNLWEFFFPSLYNFYLVINMYSKSVAITSYWPELSKILSAFLSNQNSNLFDMNIDCL